MDSVLEFLYPKLSVFVVGCWSSVATYLLQLVRYFTRFMRNGSSSSKGVLMEAIEEISKVNESNMEFEENPCFFLESLRLENDGFEEKEESHETTQEFSFTFKFPTFEEFSETQKDLSHLVKLVEPFDVSHDVVEVESNSKNGFDKKKDDFVEVETNSRNGFDKKKDDFVEVESNSRNGFDKKKKDDFVEVESNSNNGFLLDDVKKKHDFVEVESYSNSVFLLDDDKKKDDLAEVESNSNNGFLLDDDHKKVDFDDHKKEVDFDDKKGVHEKMMLETPSEKKIGEVDETKEFDTFIEEKLENFHQESFGSSSDSDTDSISSNNLILDDGFLSDGDFELEFIEKDQDEFPKSDFLSEKDFGEKSRNITEPEVSNVDINKKNSPNDATNKLESLWEHQELIEQLKMEIKKVKATGLPTIFEESESSPKIMEDLKPWKIEEMYQNGGGKMGEVHKFYKSYRERMRKFDIFNYQKMYAIGFLQLKDPLQSASSSKSSVSEITTLLSRSFATPKGKKHENDPTVKFIKELQSDLEVVYVGQMCLSWEILHWQYEKALDIWESDPRGVRRFNEIAEEFQQFQVLMQRFIEDEPFQDPRIQNYVKSRCIFRNLLQVPVIREDHLKSMKKARSEFVYDITSDMLIEILEESIRIFWRFVRADKYRRQTPVEFQKPEDSQLFIDIQKDLHKKEKKLKEQLRSGKCILKKMRRCRDEEEIEDQVVYFFCQVDMRLVSRVLQMSRLTSDQLMWCHNKLSKVSFANRKIHVEPSFLLFPC